jgi:hypothetical protein
MSRRALPLLALLGLAVVVAEVVRSALVLDPAVPAALPPVVIERTVVAERLVVWTPTVEVRVFVPTPTSQPVVTRVPPTPTPVWGGQETAGRVATR